MPIPPDYRQIVTNGHGTIPAGTAGTGTLSSIAADRIVSGSGTVFRGNESGGYLYIPSTKEKFLIENVDIEHQRLFLDKAPAAPLVTVAFELSRSKYRWVQFVELAAGVTVEGVALTGPFEPAQRNGQNLLPVYKYDATAGGTASVEINVAY